MQRHNGADQAVRCPDFRPDGKKVLDMGFWQGRNGLSVQNLLIKINICYIMKL